MVFAILRAPTPSFFMYHIRKTKTSSGATAVQVVEYVKRKLVVASHIGSARTGDETHSLENMAMQWIEKNSGQRPLFESDSVEYLLARYEYVGVRYAFIYEVLHRLMARFEFTSLGGKLLHDLVTIREIFFRREPVGGINEQCPHERR